jgi:6-phosphofructokinase
MNDTVPAIVYSGAEWEYKIMIIPEAESGVGSFELPVEFCWSRIQDTLYEAGGFICGYPEGTQYQVFANYLAWRAAHT